MQAILLLVLAMLATGCIPKPRSYVHRLHPAPFRIAVLPPANYTEMRDAPARIAAIVAGELGAVPGVEVVEQGAVEQALSQEPWLLLDRMPPDLVARVGTQLSADALLVGSILGGGYRMVDGERIPHVSLSLRLVSVPQADIMWSAVHNRDGADGEWLFGFGRVSDFEQLVGQTVQEIVRTFPVPGNQSEPSTTALKGK
jgi:hypothetical protein